MRRRRSHRDLDATLDELVARGREPLPGRAELRGLRRRVGAAVAGGVVAGSAATAATGSAAAAATVAGSAGGAVWLKMVTAGTLAVAAVTTTVAVTKPAEEPRPQAAHQGEDDASTTPVDGEEVAAPEDHAGSSLELDLGLDSELESPGQPMNEAPLPSPSVAPQEQGPGATARGLAAPPPTARRDPSPRRDDTAGRAEVATVEISAPQALGVSLLRDARAALDTRPAHTLVLVERHAAAFPRMLDQERELIAIEALLRLGRNDEGRARAERFAAEHPRSTYLPRIDALLAPR